MTPFFIEEEKCAVNCIFTHAFSLKCNETHNGPFFINLLQIAQNYLYREKNFIICINFGLSLPNSYFSIYTRRFEIVTF